MGWFRRRDEAGVQHREQQSVVERTPTGDKAAVDRYYRDLDVADDLRKAGRTDEALASALAQLAYLPALIRETRREWGRFDLGGIPAIDCACVLAAIRLDADSLNKVRDVVNAHRDLEPWKATVAKAGADMDVVGRVRAHIDATPGALQSTLGKVLGCDGRVVSQLLKYMETDGQVRRDPSNKTYQLFLVR